MKKLVVLLMLTFFVGGSIFAQQRQRATPEERAKRQTETLVKELSLTKEQETKVHEINLKYAQPKENASTDRDKRREEMRKSMDERNAAIKELLTDEQKKKFEEHIKKAPEARPRGGNR
ncbi:Spy/CpxP family protein refolding chaperone [Dysgonomonas hofstadii]|uniref:Spy/CpxP family protein refolding chaperone n=1 Tax=Dysgonomonas hofstadii TaxID=637886 RepID=A0A840CSD2_9BACT|nr:DUF4890 domain-containing protein [Dysgonomonas hofstadii]MBB4037048.1 Spy/CpxP family protein refolding chaperone [Dysgonomonas hofstadii]